MPRTLSLYNIRIVNETRRHSYRTGKSLGCQASGAERSLTITILCTALCLCTNFILGSCKGQRRPSKSPGTGVAMWVLGLNSWSSGKVVSTHNHWAISPAMFCCWCSSFLVCLLLVVLWIFLYSKQCFKENKSILLNFFVIIHLTISGN